MANKDPKILVVSQTLSLSPPLQPVRSSTYLEYAKHNFASELLCLSFFCSEFFSSSYLASWLCHSLGSLCSNFALTERPALSTLYKITSLPWSLSLLTLRYLFFHSISHHVIIFVLAYCHSFPRILAARWQVLYLFY